jgi:UDP-N-acetylmuramyl pentapeptide phosphotransferase/UDP-N-acetylglucosamine-1-phosphate transferase
LDVRILPSVPLIVERLFLGLAWVWFINLFNFMDGIDGLAGSEVVFVGAGYLVLLSYTEVESPYSKLAIIAVGAAAGYLRWNWHPAKIFMGDAGSIPLGFLLGWLMIDLALRGYWAAAIILPLSFTADAAVTLVKRCAMGNKPWEAHREHYYQRAVLGGATPEFVVMRIAAVNLVLLILAVVSLTHSLAALAAAALVSTILLFHLEGLAKRGRSSSLPGSG